MVGRTAEELFDVGRLAVGQSERGVHRCDHSATLQGPWVPAVSALICEWRSGRMALWLARRVANPRCPMITKLHWHSAGPRAERFVGTSTRWKPTSPSGVGN